MIRWAIIGAVVVMLAALWWQRSSLDAARADNDRLRTNERIMQDRIDQAREAQKVAEAYRRGSIEAAAALSEQIETVLNTDYGGCADADIDPALLLDLGRR